MIHVASENSAHHNLIRQINTYKPPGKWRTRLGVGIPLTLCGILLSVLFSSYIDPQKIDLPLICSLAVLSFFCLFWQVISTTHNWSKTMLHPGAISIKEIALRLHDLDPTLHPILIQLDTATPDQSIEWIIHVEEALKQHENVLKYQIERKNVEKDYAQLINSRTPHVELEQSVLNTSQVAGRHMKL